MNEDLRQLLDLFRSQRGEFCLEVDNGSKPFASIYGDRMSGHVPLSREQAETYIRKVKELAKLSTREPPPPQSGEFELDGRTYRVVCCPQLEGEILIFRR